MSVNGTSALQKAKVVVAMSGGVDSSVAAALLKDNGHDVVGIMLRLWSEPGKDGSNRCCTPESMALARRVSAKLDIPFYVVDVKESFRRVVVEGFLDGYGRGDTPNPCLACNRTIRWTILLEHARALGADFMATGHYAQVDVGPRNTIALRRGADRQKDQSYVLHVLQQAQLRQALFPLGRLRKDQVREIARTHGLPTAARRESQDLCFLGGADYRDFVRRHRPDVFVPGPIVDAEGRTIGRHNGLADYTIGQRKGLGISASRPMYVVKKDATNGVLFVGAASDLGKKQLTTGEVNWVSGESRRAPFRANVQIRYRAAEKTALVTPLEDGARVQIDFEENQRDITPGQAAVMYVDDEVVGGGLIQD